MRLDDASRVALRAKLAPWLELLLLSAPVATLARDGCVDAGVVVALEVDVKEALKEEVGRVMGSLAAYPTSSSTREDPLDHRRLRKVREAIDLVYLALSLDATLVWTREEDYPEDPLVKRALEGGKCVVLQVTLQAHELETADLLTRRLCAYFVESLDDKTPGNKAYRRLRDELEAKLEEANSAWRTRLVTHPVGVRYSISTSEKLKMLPYGLEDYMRSIVQFITHAAAMDGSSRSPGTSRGHLPLSVDGVTFRINEFLVTHQIAQVVVPLRGVRKGFASCELVQVDPRMLQCSAQDLTDFVGALVTSCQGKGTLVRTGPVSARAIDHYGEDRTGICDLVIRGLASCDSVLHVDLGGLITVFQSTSSRRAIYCAMLDHLFARPSVHSISFGSGMFGELDVQLFREEHSKWRNKNPGVKLQLKKLCFHAHDHASLFLAALIDVLDDVRELRAQDKSTFPSTHSEELVPLALNKFTGLRKIIIGNIDISSMDVFLGPREIPLEELAISDFGLADRASFVRFARALGDPENPLARSLRKLVIGGAHRHEDPFVLTLGDANELSRALQTNSVLRTLKLFDRAHQIETLKASTQLGETCGRIVRGKREGRKAAALQAGKVAFISIVYAQETCSSALAAFDASIIKQIFGFAALYEKRQVVLQIRRSPYGLIV